MTHLSRLWKRYVWSLQAFLDMWHRGYKWKERQTPLSDWQEKPVDMADREGYAVGKIYAKDGCRAVFDPENFGIVAIETHKDNEESV